MRKSFCQAVAWTILLSQPSGLLAQHNPLIDIPSVSVSSNSFISLHDGGANPPARTAVTLSFYDDGSGSPDTGVPDGGTAEFKVAAGGSKVTFYHGWPVN